MDKFIIHTDGGSRGNPGTAATGYVIADSTGRVLKEYGEYIGVKTNNEAEYGAAIAALKKLKSLVGKGKTKQARVQLFADSELMVKQMNHEYKVANEKIQPLFLELWNLVLDFKEVTFKAVPREQNKDADRMVNETLDAQVANKKLF